MKNIFVISYDCDNLGDCFKKCNEDLQYFINFKKFSKQIFIANITYVIEKIFTMN